MLVVAESTTCNRVPCVGVMEQSLPFAEHDWEHRDGVLVHAAVLGQRLHEISAPEGYEDPLDRRGGSAARWRVRSPVKS